MVDHLSRLKKLVFQLGLEHNIPSLPDKHCVKPLNVNNSLHEVELRTKPEGNSESHDQVENDDDDVFSSGTDGNHVAYVHRYRQVKRTAPVSKHQINAPVVNKRLRQIKRPLEATRSVPLSPNAIPDYKRRQEQKLRANIDFLCGEMVLLRQKDQEIAKSLLKIYTEIQKLKLKQSCLQHQELLEEATFNATEADYMPDMCDAPHKYMSKILLNRGVTKQNLAWRRFSCS